MIVKEVGVGMRKKDSERERLLRLIDGDEQTIRAMKLEGPSLPQQTFAFPLSGIIRPSPRTVERLGPVSGMSLLTRSLLVVLALLISYGAIDLLAHFLVVKQAIPVMSEEPMLDLGGLTGSSQKARQYADAAVRDDVFSPQRIQEVPAEGPAPQTGISGSLKLVGIDWDGDPVAMIEDVQSGKTYFAKENTKIEDVKVIKIQPDSVVISRGDIMEEIK